MDRSDPVSRPPERPWRIAVFIPSAFHFALTPSIIHTIRLLASRGYALDVIVTSHPRAPTAEIGDSRVQVVTVPASERPVKLLPHFLRYLICALKLCFNRRYLCIIGVDRNGLITAMVIGAVCRAPAVYFSLEIELVDHGAPLWTRVKKWTERWCHRRAKLTLIQDQVRADLLLKENRVPGAQVLILPNSAPCDLTSHTRGDYWNTKLGIPRSSVIFLHAGGIAEINCVPALAHVAHSWPDGWVLVIHGYGEESSIARVRPLVDRARVFLSLETVPPERLDAIVGSATIGIALYDTAYGPNVTRVGLASGKILQYMKCGLPTIASDLPGMRQLLVDTGCGAVVSSVEEVERAAGSILSDLDGYRERSKSHFTSRWSFDRHFTAFLDWLSVLDA